MNDMTDRSDAILEATRFAKFLGRRTELDWSPTWESHRSSHDDSWDWTWGAVLRFGTGRLTVLRMGDVYEWRVELLEVGVTYQPKIGPFPRDPVAAAVNGLRDSVWMVAEWRDVVRDADAIADDLNMMIERASDEVRDGD